MVTEREPDTFVKTVLTFGDKPAPAMAQIALRKTATEVLTNNTYMDDICESVDTEKEARKLTSDIDNVLKTGGIKVREWISNKVLKEKVNGDTEKEIDMFKGDEEKVLGTLWNFKTDKFPLQSDSRLTEARKQSKPCTDDYQKNDPESSGSHLRPDWIFSSVHRQNKDRNAKTVAAGTGLGWRGTTCSSRKLDFTLPGN